ncbi:hypothetical protein EDB83DRAFT_2327274 [Lactarius deliciosus]|nr:hypothetical protein EDB83DRAFT_2327274 [Lactarius deliciosus]
MVIVPSSHHWSLSWWLLLCRLHHTTSSRGAHIKVVVVVVVVVVICSPSPGGVGGGVGGAGGTGGGEGMLNLERKKCLAEAESEAWESYTPITIAHGPPTGTGDTIRGMQSTTTAFNYLSQVPIVTSSASQHASPWPPPPTHRNTQVPIIATPFSVQEPPQHHPHMACDPCRYDTNDDSNQVDDDGDAVGDGSGDGGGDAEGNSGSDAEGNGDSDAEGDDSGDAAAGMTWR